MPALTRYPLAAAVRSASVTLLNEYAADESLKLQVYPARPKSLAPPTGFVDRMTEQVEHTVSIRQRTCRAEVLVLHGLFDSKEAVTQRDAFVDGFMEWCEEHLDAAGANTTLELVAVEDEPAYVPDWRPANVTNGPNPTYYATRITLEGFAGN
jgi:hypothetical protein